MEPEITISTNNLSIKQVVLFANKKVGFYIGEKTTEKINEYRNNLIEKWKENKNKFDIKDYIYNENNCINDLKKQQNSNNGDEMKISNDEMKVSSDEIKLLNQQHEQIKDQQLPQQRAESLFLNGINNINTTSTNNNNTNLNESLIIENSTIVSNDYLPDKVIRASLLIQLNLLSSGTSGISLGTLGLLIKRLKEDDLPLVTDNCSNGFNDSISLSQSSLSLFGKSIPLPNGKILKPQHQHSTLSDNSNGNDIINSDPHLKEQLSIQESNSLINNNCITLASGILLLSDISNFLNAIDISASFSMEAFRANLDSLNSVVSKVHNHSGQVQCSNNFQNILNFSKLWDTSSNSNLKGSNTTSLDNIIQDRVSVQDPTSFRCISQIHGASYSAFDWCYNIFEKEINLSVDNPLIIANNEDNGFPFSNGNSDTGLLSLSMDTLRSSLCRCLLILSQRICKLPWKQFSNIPISTSNKQQHHYHFQMLNLCKIASSIITQIQHLTNPVLNLSSGMQLMDGYEDTTPNTPLSIKNTKLLIEQGWKLITIEIIISIYCIKQRNIHSGSIGFGLRSLYNSIITLVPFSTSPPILHSPPVEDESKTFSIPPVGPPQILDTRSIENIIKNFVCDA